MYLGLADWDFGVDMYSLLYLEQIINEDLLYNSRKLCLVFIL